MEYNKLVHITQDLFVFEAATLIDLSFVSCLHVVNLRIGQVFSWQWVPNPWHQAEAVAFGTTSGGIHKMRR